MTVECDGLTAFWLVRGRLVNWTSGVRPSDSRPGVGAGAKMIEREHFHFPSSICHFGFVIVMEHQMLLAMTNEK
jgi:hypothetical protein